MFIMDTRSVPIRQWFSFRPLLTGWFLFTFHLACQEPLPVSDSPDTDTPEGQTLRLPSRPNDAADGSILGAVLRPLPLREREDRIYREITAGNVPSFLRDLQPVTIQETVNGSTWTVTLYITPDYLALGSDADYVLMPMTPILAQRLADTLGACLPTRKIVTKIWQVALVKLAPESIPPSAAMVTVPVFLAHNDMIWSQRGTSLMQFPLGCLVAGHKKDVILSNRIATQPDKVVIYGWHQLNGQPIQPLYSGHANWYADYSHGIRLLYEECYVNGNWERVVDILSDAERYSILSDEAGPMVQPHYPVDLSDYP